MDVSTLGALLDHPGRDALDFHLALAGPVRSMLCDADWPTLLKLAGELGVSLRVWAPHQPPEIASRAPTFYMNALTVSVEPVAFAHEMLLAEFLDAPIGAVAIPDQSTGRPKGRWYTARQLIKWAANKDGPAHFDPDTPATYVALGQSLISSGEVTMVGPAGETPLTRSDNILTRTALLQIAQATLALANRVLAEVPESAA